MLFGASDRQKMRRTLEERWLRHFLHRSAMVRWFIALGTLGSLIALALSSRRVELEDLTVGQISPRTIVARVNFSYEDERSTELERARLATLTPSVYRLVLDPWQKGMGRVKHLLEREEALRQSGKINQDRLRKIADIWNENSEILMDAGDIQALMFIPDKKSFGDLLAGLTRKPIEKGIVGDDQFSKPETTFEYSTGPNDLSQLKMARADQFPTVRDSRSQIMRELGANGSVPKASIKTVEKLVTVLLIPNVQLDLSLSAKLQEQERQGVKPHFYNITKGSPLIERGERFTEDKLAMFKAHRAEVERNFSSESRWRQRAGIAAVVALIVGAGILILAFQRASGAPSGNRDYALLASLVVLHVAICRLMLYLTDSFTPLSPSIAFCLIPYCLGPMLVAILIHGRHAQIAAWICSFLLGALTQFNFAVILTALVSAVVGIHFLSPLRRRIQIYQAGLLSGLAAAGVHAIFGLMTDVTWPVMGGQVAWAVGSGFAASLLVNAFLPLFESIFKVTTHLRWLELSDLNHPLLRRMVMEAPGTYHHSLVVANLAERACEEIGAQALKARVCSYFHDIGKLNNPEYFCENQAADHNPHQDITPNMSALIIMAHVKDGVDMAIQHRLARSMIDSIQQHHGTTQVTYFYRLAKRYEEDIRLGSKIMKLNVNDVPRVEEETFRYPGPKPSTREIGIISLADAVEGASRSLLKPTPQKIEALISEIIEERLQDGQLDECPLNLIELRKVAESFTQTLLSMLHTRISYPKDESFADQPPSISSAAAS